MEKLENRIRTALENRYSNYPRPERIIDNLKLSIELFYEYKLNDKNTIQRIESIDNNIFYQQMSEVIFAKKLIDEKYTLTKKSNGPDIVLYMGKNKINIEVICPTSKGIPEWYFKNFNEIGSIPHKEILLRWTSAIKEKKEKFYKYIKTKVIDKDDINIIAINGRLLNNSYRCITGISQMPYGAEATLGIGPISVKFSRKTMKIIDQTVIFQGSIKNKNESDVRTIPFLDNEYQEISALWCASYDEQDLFHTPGPSAIIHNPMAFRELEKNQLPVFREYITTISSDSYEVSRLDGRLKTS